MRSRIPECKHCSFKKMHDFVLRDNGALSDSTLSSHLNAFDHLGSQVETASLMIAAAPISTASLAFVIELT